MTPGRTSKGGFPTLIASQAQLITSQREPERWWSIVIKDARLYKVCAGVQLLGHIDARNLFPIAIRLKTDRNAVDFHFGASHSAKTQTRSRRLVHQNKLASECCIKAGKPMRARIYRARKNNPLRPSIMRQKIDCRIMPCNPCQD